MAAEPLTLHRVIVRTPVTYIPTGPTTGIRVGHPTPGSFDPATVRITPAGDVRPGDVVLGTCNPRYDHLLNPRDLAQKVTYFTGTPRPQKGGARPFDPAHCDLCAHNGSISGVRTNAGWVSVDGCTLYSPDTLLLAVPREYATQAAPVPLEAVA